MRCPTAVPPIPVAEPLRPIRPTSLLASARLLIALWALALGWCALAPSPARAGTYHVYACQLPNGAAIPASDWVFERSGNETALPLGQDLCATDGYAALEQGAEPTAAGAWTGWGLTLPTGLKATLMTFYRWNQIRSATTGADDQAHPAAEFIYGQTKRWYDPSTTIPEWCYYGEGCTGYGWPNVSTAGGPRIDADFPGGASFIGFALRCRTDTGKTGGTCGGRPGGRALERILGIDLTIRDDTAPVAVGGSGTLTEPGARSGTAGLRYAATDVGGGVYYAVLEIDGKEVARYKPDSAPSCTDAGVRADDPDEFLVVQPCSRSIGVGFDVDTTRLSAGPHRATSYVIDTAAARSNAVVRDFTVDNTPVALPTPTPAPIALPTPTPIAPTPTPAATPNGAGGDRASAQLRASKNTVAATYGAKKVLLTGRLLDSAGTPVADAAIEVSERLSTPSATWVKLATVRSGADGTYRYAPATTASRAVRFTYATELGAAPRATQDVEVTVTAGMSISAKPKVVPRRGLIRLAGQVRIDALPASGTWVEVQVLQGKVWRTVGTRRVDTKGRWTYKHRLKTAANTTLAFRSRLRPASDLASAQAHSAPIRIRVR